MTEPLSPETFARLAQEMSSAREVEHTLEQVVRLAARTVDGCDAAGVSLRVGQGAVETPACTDPVVARADSAQYELDEGPCLDAIREHTAYVAQDLTVDRRWPRWAPRAVELGLGSMLTVRLAAPEGTIGALNLYARSADAFDAADVEVAQVFAVHAALALAASREADGLRTAMTSRHGIGLAQGILMERHGLTPDMAFAVLRRYSQDANVKLRDVARQVVEGHPALRSGDLGVGARRRGAAAVPLAVKPGPPPAARHAGGDAVDRPARPEGSTQG
ncbi:GAF and ANTAR domain-containing protein [Thalassiella azotivora]